uniref:RRM domain-containing protein n=1 Tax=Pyrodinium bahamense TaxID=73915 RepID=A0A7S0A6Y6_9DINO
MERVAYALMQDRLSTVGSFILCDGMADSFPIRYASRGFVELFGYTATECLGRPCGALVATSITEAQVAKVSTDFGLSTADAQKAISVHTGQIIEECKNIMANPGEHISFSLVLNRTKTGNLFVCEVLMMAMEHPVVGWPYTIGLQRDVSDQVSVRELLQATSESALQELINRETGPVKDRIANLKLDTDMTREYFNSKSADMWEDMMRMVLEWKGELKVQHLAEGSVSLSTADGETEEHCTSYDSGSSCRDALPVCLHVKNLAESTTAEQLSELFRPYGPVLEVEAPGARAGGAGVGVVVLSSAEGATRAAAELGGQRLGSGGSELKVAVGAVGGMPMAAVPLSFSKAIAVLACGSAWSAIQCVARKSLGVY